MSVFSTIYNEFQDQINESDKLLDLEHAPAELLMEYANWMGIMVQGEFLSEDTLRSLVKEAYNLNKYKGTRYSIERVCEILLGEKPIIVEKNYINDSIREEDKNTYNMMYGESAYDVTLLIPVYVDEKKRSQLFYLLKQFKPIRSRLRIVFLQDSGIMDSYSYLDMNAKVFEQKYAALDERQLINGTVVLQ